MKKCLIALGLMFACFTLVYSAAPLMNQAPISGYGTPGVTNVSTTTLTKVPSLTTQTPGRAGVYLSLQSTGTQYGFAGFLGDCTSTSVSAAIRPIVISTQSLTSSIFLPIREDVCAWLISMDVAASTTTALNYQEVKR